MVYFQSGSHDLCKKLISQHITTTQQIAWQFEPWLSQVCQPANLNLHSLCSTP